MLGTITALFTISLTTLAAIHYLSIHLYLYWRHTWLDIPMHFAGGAIAAFGVFTAAELWPRFPERWLRLLPVLAVVLIVALAWEVFGYYIDVQVESNYRLDTLIDIAMGLLGGSIGWLVAHRIRAL